MSDSPDLTPEQDAVRRLLAEARHEGPPPPEVVARLDETLASLVAERVDAPLDPPVTQRPAPVVHLGARRRRLAGVGLLAAAAVVVAGVALGQALPRMSGSDDAGSAAEGAADRDTSSRQFDAESPTTSDDPGAQVGPESLKSSAPSPLAGLPTLSTADPDLADRLLRLRREAAARTKGQSAAPDTQGACLMRGIGPGRRLLAEVDGQPGTVVYQPPSGDAQVVAVYVCGSGEPVRTLTLPAP